MKLSSVIIVNLCLVGSVLSFRSRGFVGNITTECLDRLPKGRNDDRNMLYRPVAYTLESFIALVEKVEHKHPLSNIFEITNMLLERFYYSEMTMVQEGTKAVFKRDPHKRHRSEFLTKMLDSTQKDDAYIMNFFSDYLTVDERCSLYFMIGHNIKTSSYDTNVDRLSNDVPSDQTLGDGKNSVYPVEEGLVSLHSDSVNAVAMGRVLLGIAAGKYKGQSKSLSHFDSTTPSDSIKDLQVECLASLTIGDAVANAEISPRTVQSSTKYGPPGEWNTTACPVEYRLSSDKITTTDAEMRGSIDGYILGYYVDDLEREKGSALTLSRLIRSYYSKHGIKVGSSEIGFCRRSTVIGDLEVNLKDSVTNVLKFYRFRLESPEQDNENWMRDYNEYVVKHLQERPLINICQQSLTTIENKLPETPLDVFFVLDVTEHDTKGMREQIEVLGHLSGYLDVGYGAGSMTVLLNSRNEISDVRTLLYNATNSGCVSCTLERLAQRDFRMLERDSVAGSLEMLNRTIRTYKESRLSEDGVPARVVIYFHYDTNVVEDDAKLNDARVQLYYGHRELQIFAIGTGEILEKIATSMSNKFTDSPDPMHRAHKLREEISKVPAILQYEECGNRRYKNEGDHVYHGYVTPDEKQLWAMYPEFFLKSYNIEFKFKAENGRIKVCYDRGEADPSRLDHTKFCKEVENPGGEVVFPISNPCHGRTRLNCQPFNFAVIGIPGNNNPANQCTDAKCRRLDQIKFTVSHKGVSCNSALGLLASPIVFFAAVCFALRNLM